MHKTAYEMRISDRSSDVCSSDLLEYVGQGVRVNTIVPGGVKTPIQANVTPEQVEWYKAQIPMGYLGEPNDIAYGALYLLSDEAKYVTGTEQIGRAHV